MVPAADPCHHVWARHMAGIASFTFIDVACCCWMEIINHTTFTNIFVFPSRWNGVSGKCSWLTSWEDSRLRSPFLFLLSKCMLNTSHTHFGLNNKRTSPSSSSEFFELTNNLEVCKLKWKKCPENVCFFILNLSLYAHITLNPPLTTDEHSCVPSNLHFIIVHIC